MVSMHHSPVDSNVGNICRQAPVGCPVISMHFRPREEDPLHDLGQNCSVSAANNLVVASTGTVLRRNNSKYPLLVPRSSSPLVLKDKSIIQI